MVEGGSRQKIFFDILYRFNYTYLTADHFRREAALSEHTLIEPTSS